MIFRYPQKSIHALPNLLLYINEHELEKVDTFDFLGITINETLSWRNHIDKIATKISKVIGIMSRCKRYLSSDVLIKIYNSLILSRINYGLTCWGFDNKRIYKLQKKALRIICKKKYNAHTDPLFIYLKTMKVNDIFQNQCLKFYYKYEKSDLPGYFRDLLTENRPLHSYNMRARPPVHINRTNKKSSEKILRHYLPEFINTIPDNIKRSIHTHSLQSVFY